MTSSFTFDSSRPIYEQIIDYIYDKIAVGELKHGDKLESVRELAYTVGVNPNTVQRAYMELERSGIVEVRRGQGTFVAVEPSTVQNLKEQKSKRHVTHYIENMQKLGFTEQEMMESLKAALDQRRKSDD